MPFPESLKKKIRARANFRCCVCHRLGVDIHHIVPQAGGGDDTADNAAPLCPNCHREYGANPEKRKTIREMRDHWYEHCSQSSSTTPEVKDMSEDAANNVIIFPKINKGVNVVNNYGTVIQNYDKKAPRNKTVKMNPPEGAIASSLAHINYIKHLIDRYHEFKRTDVGQQEMKRPILYGTIKREFGAKWDMIPIKRFESLAEFLRKRIDRTILGKSRKSKGQKNYSEFSEYVDKYG